MPRDPDVQRLVLEAMEPGRESRGSTREERANRVDNINPTSKGGNSALYTLKRLKRDRRGLACAWRAGRRGDRCRLMLVTTFPRGSLGGDDLQRDARHLDDRQEHEPGDSRDREDDEDDLVRPITHLFPGLARFKALSSSHSPADRHSPI